jgi:hypothetical protein
MATKDVRQINFPPLFFVVVGSGIQVRDGKSGSGRNIPDLQHYCRGIYVYKNIHKRRLDNTVHEPKRWRNKT